VCGALEVEIGGRRLESRLPGRRGQLVAYLAVNRHRSVRREELIDALWPLDPPARPEATFATLLARTRAEVGHEVITGGAHLHLELGSDTWIDWEVAQQAADAARDALGAGNPIGALAIAEKGLAIVDRGFLQAYEAAWVDERRRELDELRSPLAEVLARAALALGGDHLPAAERAARAMIGHDPFRETGYALLMEALAAAGNDAEAVRTYDRLRSLLREHLGLTPSPAVTALAERLIRPQSAASAAAEGIDGAAPNEEVQADEPAELPHAVASIADRPLTGRNAERRELLEVAADVARGERRVVLVCGEPGIGKTRLAVCIASMLYERGWNVLYGRADRESVITYQPVLEALRHFLADRRKLETQLEQLLGPELVELSRMIPTLRPLVSSPPESDALEPHLERFRVFEAVAALIGSATAHRPALLILDDLHWADRSTLVLLRHVIRSTAGCRLFILGTFRDTEESIGEPLGEFLDELWHESLLTRVTLDGLVLAETLDLVRGYVPDASKKLVEQLHHRTDGNPFYVEETLRGLRTTHGEQMGLPVGETLPIPERVKQMIEWRVGQLPGGASGVLKAAAVLGPEFELETAAAVGRVTTEDGLEALDIASRAGLVVPDPERPDRYVFRHSLVREALYEAIPSSKRARLHLVAGEMLERADAGSSEPAELAVHFSNARHVGGADAALRWRLSAAAQATLQHAHEESAEHQRHALEALDLLPADDQRRATILLGQGRSLIRAGDLADGRGRLFEAAELARQIGAVEILADCALELGSFYLSPGGVDADQVSLLEEALEGLRGSEHRARCARVMARLPAALYWEPTARSRSQELAEEAVRLATQGGDVGAVALAVASGHCAHWVSERPAALLDEAERTIELAQQARDEELELVARTWRVNHLLGLARIADVDEEIDRFVALAARLRQSRCSWYAPLFLAVRSMIAGRLEEAEGHIVAAAELGARVPGSTSPMLAGAQLFLLRWLQGRLDELEDAVTAYVDAYPRQLAWRCALAFLNHELDQRDRAGQVIDDIFARGVAEIPHDNLWLVAIAMLGEACAGSGTARQAAEIEQTLARYAGVCVVSPSAGWLGPVDRVLGLLAAAQNRLDHAVARFGRAAELCEQAHSPSMLALARLDHAETLRSRNRRSDAKSARTLARAALTTAETTGMRRAARRALSILHRDSPGDLGDAPRVEDAIAAH
jgi:DNA-binding SARP family transcriptional activator